jgi:hypothetical protein
MHAMNELLQDQIGRRGAERNTEGAKKLAGAIIDNLDDLLSSGRLTKTDAEHVKQLLFRLTASLIPLAANFRLLDPKTSPIGATFLWQIIRDCYLAGQVTPNTLIAEDILGPIARKEGSRGGRTKAENQKTAKDAKRDAVLRLKQEIESSKPGITKEKLASEIEASLPNEYATGHSQILKIMRAGNSGT